MACVMSPVCTTRSTRAWFRSSTMRATLRNWLWVSLMIPMRMGFQAAARVGEQLVDEAPVERGDCVESVRRSAPARRCADARCGAAGSPFRPAPGTRPMRSSGSWKKASSLARTRQRKGRQFDAGAHAGAVDLERARGRRSRRAGGRVARRADGVGRGGIRQGSELVEVAAAAEGGPGAPSARPRAIDGSPPRFAAPRQSPSRISAEKALRFSRPVQRELEARRRRAAPGPRARIRRWRGGRASDSGRCIHARPNSGPAWSVEYTSDSAIRPSWTSRPALWRSSCTSAIAGQRPLRRPVARTGSSCVRDPRPRTSKCIDELGRRGRPAPAPSRDALGHGRRASAARAAPRARRSPGRRRSRSRSTTSSGSPVRGE